MNRAQRRAAAATSKLRTWTIGRAYDACPFRSLVSIIPGSKDELLGRVGAAFAAIDGEIAPISVDRVADLVDAVLAERTVIVMGSRADLRDAAKGQLMAAVNAAALGAAGSA